MEDILPRIGAWSSGEPIDIQNVPLIRTVPLSCGVHLVEMFDAQNGGQFVATYTFISGTTKSGARGHKRIIDAVYSLSSVEEQMPPKPPQIQGFGDDVRLPMMRDGAYDPTLEAEQRKMEWQEWRANKEGKVDEST